MSIYDKFKGDKSLEANGVWVDYGEFKVLLARAGGSNKKYMKALQKSSAPIQKSLRLGTVDPEEIRKVLADVFSKTIILDWHTKRNGEMVPGIDDPEGGELLPATPENIKMTLINLPDLFDDFQQQAEKLSIFREDQLEEEAKN